MSEIHALSGAYAVDALDDIERAQFEQHLVECAECRAEVASFRETGALLAETEAEAPPASLRSSVLAGISQVRPLPPDTAPAETTVPAQPAQPTQPTQPAVRRRRLPHLLLAAAAVLLAVGVLAWHPWQHDTATIAEQVLNAPDAVRVTEQLPNGGGRLTLVRSPSLGRAVMIGDHVPAPGDGKTYQLWLQQPGRGMVSAGLMPDADQPTVLTGNLSTAQAAAVSVEPAAGSKTPTLPALALFPLGTAVGGTDPA